MHKPNAKRCRMNGTETRNIMHLKYKCPNISLRGAWLEQKNAPGEYSSGGGVYVCSVFVSRILLLISCWLQRRKKRQQRRRWRRSPQQ